MYIPRHLGDLLLLFLPLLLGHPVVQIISTQFESKSHNRSYLRSTLVLTAMLINLLF